MFDVKHRFDYICVFIDVYVCTPHTLYKVDFEVISNKTLSVLRMHLLNEWLRDFRNLELLFMWQIKRKANQFSKSILNLNCFHLHGPAAQPSLSHVRVIKATDQQNKEAFHSSWVLEKISIRFSLKTQPGLLAYLPPTLVATYLKTI